MTALCVVLEILGGILILGLLVLIIRALTIKNKSNGKPFVKQEGRLEEVEKHISQAISIATVSQVDESAVDKAQFEKFADFLQKTYPLVHSRLSKQVIGGALVFFLPGSDPSLEPIAMLAHQDVVPVSTGTEGDWTHPPFSGHNDGEFIWGRGALDMKNHLIAVMEATENLLKKGFAPKRGLYILLGCNEEIVASENSSAKKVAAYLEENGVRLKCVVDEGGGVIPLSYKNIIDKTLVGIGVAEKGYLDVELSVSAVLNMRLMPGVSIDDAVTRLKKIIRDERISVKILKGNPAPPVSSTKTDTFKLAAKLLGEGCSDRTVAPYIVMGATDSRYYTRICDEIYRISPFQTPVSLLLTTHGTNERLPISSIKTAVKFFEEFIEQRTAF